MNTSEPLFIEAISKLVEVLMVVQPRLAYKTGTMAVCCRGDIVGFCRSGEGVDEANLAL